MGSQAPEHRLSSYGAWAWLLRGMRNPPRSGAKPVSPPLACGLFISEPPGTPPLCHFLKASSWKTVHSSTGGPELDSSQQHASILKDTAGIRIQSLETCGRLGVRASLSWRENGLYPQKPRQRQLTRKWALWGWGCRGASTMLGSHKARNTVTAAGGVSDSRELMIWGHKDGCGKHRPTPGFKEAVFCAPPPAPIFFFLPPSQICILLKSPGGLGTGLDQLKPLISRAASSMDYTGEEGPALGRRPCLHTGYKERKVKTFQKENKAKKTKRSQAARAGEDNLVPLSLVHTLWDPPEPGFSNLHVQRDPLGLHTRGQEGSKPPAEIVSPRTEEETEGPVPAMLSIPEPGLSKDKGKTSVTRY